MYMYMSAGVACEVGGGGGDIDIFANINRLIFVVQWNCDGTFAITHFPEPDYYLAM